MIVRTLILLSLATRLMITTVSLDDKLKKQAKFYVEICSIFAGLVTITLPKFNVLLYQNLIIIANNNTVELLLSGPCLSGHLSYPDDKPDAKN